MIESEIYELLYRQDARSHPAWGAFVAQMAGAQYGRDSLNQGWYFFRRGWEARDAIGNEEREKVREQFRQARDVAMASSATIVVRVLDHLAGCLGIDLL